MSNSKNIKRRGKYRTVGYYRHNGEEVVGLKRRPNGRFYASDKPTKTFGSDPALAVHRFNMWQVQTGEGALEPLDDIALGQYPNYIYRLRNLILSDPSAAALELNIPELAYFAQLRPPPDPTMTLSELGEKYVTEKRNKRGRHLTFKHQNLSRFWWGEFLGFVNVTLATQITEKHIDEYNRLIMGRFDEGMSPTYVKHRFGKIKAVLAFGVKQGIDTEVLEKVLKTCIRKLDAPAPLPPDANPISPEHFHSLLTLANIRQKAILLTALNLCLKSGEIADLNKEDIDFEKQTLVTTRNKTGTTRVGVLWNETIEAIQNYLAKAPHKQPQLFNSRMGTRLVSKEIGQIVVQLRRRLKIPEDVNFDTIRDGAYTAAIEGGADLLHTKLLAGHKVGMSDQYVRRNPRMVKDACEAIYAKYFPGKS